MVKKSSEVGNKGMVSLNGNVLCAIDTETTGLVAGYHDLIEVAIVPLGADLEPMKDVVPFHTLLRPKRLQNVDQKALDINKITLEELEVNGVDPYRAADLLEQWFVRLGLVPGKKIAPLAKNWVFDGSFIKDWLGGETFNQLFYHRVRELSAIIHFFNDRSDFQCEPPPFPQTSLEQVVSRLGLSFPTRAHRALDDAVMTAAVYKKLMFKYIK